MNKERSALPVPLSRDSTTLAAPPLVRPWGGRARRPPPASPERAPRRRIDLRLGLLCLALTVGIGAALIPALRIAFGGVDGMLSPEDPGPSLDPGLPSVTDTAPPAETRPDELTGDAAGAGTPPETPPDAPPDASEEESTNGRGDEENAPPCPDPAGTAAPAPTDTYAGHATSPAEPETLHTPPDTSSATEEADKDEPTGADTRPPDESEPVPEGCYPIVSVDMSESQRGEGFVTGNAGNLPPSLSGGGLWSTVAAPTVLIVNTHPYEGYGDGSGFYDPSAGGLALTSSPTATDGTVALAAALTRELRGQGVTVIHLRIAVAAGDTAADTYERTATTVRAYCRMYPDIGLVLDLRRSAELTETGEILRTAGELDGMICAQLRVSVGGGRPQAERSGDLAAALALRAALWETEPTLSRPVHVRAGGGLLSDAAGVRCLTLEMGSAGNTFDEASRLTRPVADALAKLVLEEK